MRTPTSNTYTNTGRTKRAASHARRARSSRATVARLVVSRRRPIGSVAGFSRPVGRKHSGVRYRLAPFRLASASMSKPNPAELPGSMVVLGLLIERPGQTVAEVAESLEERFERSRFDPATAHNALPQMARSGRYSPRVNCIYKAPERGHKAQDRYEPTREGIRVYRAWMHAVPSESGPPALREALYGRIELCRLEDLPELIRIAREEELIARDMYSGTSVTLKQHMEAERERDTDGDELTDRDYLRMVREVLLYVTPQHWAARHSLMDEIRTHLEGIATKAGIPFTVPK
jgi:hypothetical protein